jgi:hypothetical protein
LNGDAFDVTAGQNAMQFHYDAAGPIHSTPNNIDYGFLMGKDRDNVFSTALMFDTTYIPFKRWRVQVGPQLYLSLLAQPDINVTAIAIGAATSLTVIERLHFSIYGSAFWAPSVLTFGPGNSVTDFTAGGQIGLLPHLSVLAGYRWFEFHLTDAPSRNVANQVFVGFRWSIQPEAPIAH